MRKLSQIKWQIRNPNFLSLGKHIVRILIETGIAVVIGIVLIIAFTGGFSVTLWPGAAISAYHLKQPLMLLFGLLIIKKFLTGTFWQGFFWFAPLKPSITKLNNRLEQWSERWAQSRYPMGFALLVLVLCGIATVGMGFVTQHYSLERGLIGQYYDNPDWQGKPITTARDTIVDLRRIHGESLSMEENYSVEWTGALEIPFSGKYTFSTMSDDGSELYLDNKRVVDNSGIHGVETRSETVYLPKGFYPIMIRYMQGTGGALLHVSWAPKGKAAVEIPAQLLFPAMPTTRASRGIYREKMLRFIFSIMKFVWFCGLMTVIVIMFKPRETPYHVFRFAVALSSILLFGEWLLWRQQGHVVITVQDEVMGWMICEVGVLYALFVNAHTVWFSGSSSRPDTQENTHTEGVQAEKSGWSLARMFRHGEELVLVILPGFLLASVYTYLPEFFWYALPVIFFVVWNRNRSSHDRLKASVLQSLLIASFTAFVLTILTIYDINDLYWYADTAVLAHCGEQPLSDWQFWLFNLPKPSFLSPLLFRLFHNDLAALNECFIVLYVLSAFVLMAAIVRFVTTQYEKMLACYLFILLFLNQHDMSLWLSTALSEAPSIAVTLIMLALFGLLYRYRTYLNQSSRRVYAGIGLVFLSTLLFVAGRDTNLYASLFLMGFYWAVFQRWTQRLIIGILFLAIFFTVGEFIEASVVRWDFPLGNTLLIRIVPDDNLRKLFQTRYHLPPDELVMPCANVRYVDPCPEESKAAVTKWTRTYGLSAFKHFLVTNPGYSIGEWLKAWDTSQENLWRLEFRPYYYADERVRDKQLNPLIFSFPGFVSLPLAIALFLFGIIMIRKNPLILLCLFHAGIIGFIAYHGDPFEIGRHSQQSAMTLKIALLLAIIHVYPMIKACYRPTRR